MADGVRSVIQGVLWVPGKLGIQNGLLLASSSPDRRRRTTGGRPRAISPLMLAEFAEIGVTGEESKLLRFAKRYGPLGICKHGLPSGHNRQSFARINNVGDCNASPSSVPGWDQSEPLAKWFAFARQAQAILSCSASLHRGKRPNPEDLKTAYPPWGILKPGAQAELNMETARRLIESAINTWIHYGGLRPHFRWRLSGCSVIFSAGEYCSVFGALAAQLMLATANRDGFVICSNCGRAYIPARRPNPNRRSFCHPCGLKAAWRYSKQDLRNRLKG
jgi:hypothetical protein